MIAKVGKNHDLKIALLQFKGVEGFENSDFSGIVTPLSSV